MRWRAKNRKRARKAERAENYRQFRDAKRRGIRRLRRLLGIYSTATVCVSKDHKTRSVRFDSFPELPTYEGYTLDEKGQLVAPLMFGQNRLLTRDEVLEKYPRSIRFESIRIESPAGPMNMLINRSGFARSKRDEYSWRRSPVAPSTSLSEQKRREMYGDPED